MEKPGELQQSDNTAMMAVEKLDEKFDHDAPSEVDISTAEKSHSQSGDSELAEPKPEPKKVHTAREWSTWRKIITVAFVAIFAFLRYVIRPGTKKKTTQSHAFRTLKPPSPAYLAGTLVLTSVI